MNCPSRCCNNCTTLKIHRNIPGDYRGGAINTKTGMTCHNKLQWYCLAPELSPTSMMLPKTNPPEYQVTWPETWIRTNIQHDTIMRILTKWPMNYPNWFQMSSIMVFTPAVITFVLDLDLAWRIYCWSQHVKNKPIYIANICQVWFDCAAHCYSHIHLSMIDITQFHQLITICFRTTIVSSLCIHVHQKAMRILALLLFLISRDKMSSLCDMVPWWDCHTVGRWKNWMMFLTWCRIRNWIEI